MSSINEAYVIQQYTDGCSTIVLAKELDTYPKKIERILKRNGQSLRSKSESQALAIKEGRAKHPTEGSQRTEEQKIKISNFKSDTRSISFKPTNQHVRKSFK